MKQLSNRGAARVSAVWMIVVVVLFFVALAFAYVSNQATAQERDNAAAARATATAAEAARATAEAALVDLSVPVGFRDESTVGSATDITGVSDAIQTMKDAFGMGETVDTLEETVNPAIAALNARNSEIQTLQARISVLESEKEAADAAARDAAAELRDQISTLEKAKDDEAQVAADQIATLESDLDDRTRERDDLDDQLNALLATNDDLVVQMANQDSDHEARTTQLQKEFSEFKTRFESPDGAVVSVSKELGLGWINRGARDRVAAGMVFDIHTGHPNPSGPAIKAQCEVLSVNPDTSRIRIYNVADPYDPVVADDVLYNPIYDPNGERNAVLAGRFGGTYNEAELATMLGEIGITVQQDLDLTTNYLIVGQPMYVDEDGDRLEEPRQPSDLPVYKNAQAQGCAIISINDFRAYFKR